MEKIKELIEKLQDKIEKDPSIKELFLKDPVAAVEKVLGVDLPDDLVDKVIDGVKAKIAGDKLGDALGKLKKLF